MMLVRRRTAVRAVAAREGADVAAGRWVIALLIGLLLAAPLGSAAAQYAEGLPPGVVAAEVDNQPIDAINVPQTSSQTPQIAGRINTGALTVDLAIADGDIVRFTLDVDERGRFRGTAPAPLAPGQYALYIFDALVGSFVVTEDAGAEGTPRARGERDGGGRLDIARAAPEPADFGEAIPGLALLEGAFTTLDQEARRIATANGDDSREAIAAIRQDLDDAGWRQRYESRLAVPDPSDPSRFALQVSSSAVEYASAEQAASAFAATAGSADAIAGTQIGQASELVVLTGTTPDTGVEYRALRLLFVQDRVLGLIVVADLLGGEPDQALLEAVGQSVAVRAAAVSAGDIRGEATRALRLDPPAASNVALNDAYQVVDGFLVPLYGEDDRGRAAREATFSGTYEAFVGSALGTVRQGGQRDDGTANERAFAYQTTVMAFPTPDDASIWIANLPTLLANDPLRGYTAFDSVASAPLVGEESAVFAVSRDVGTPLDGFRAYIRVGAEVAIVEFAAAPAATLDEALTLANEQAACLERGRCQGSAAVPGFASEADGPADDDQPEDGSGENRRDRDDQGGQRGGVRDVSEDEPATGSDDGGDDDAGATEPPGGAIEIAPSEPTAAPEPGVSPSDSPTPTPAAPRGGVRDVTPAADNGGG